MVARRNEESNSETPRRRPASTPDGRERQLIDAAVDLAEKQLRDGSASAQVITHYLKLGSSREQLEQERIAKENLLLDAKREALEAQKAIGGLIEDALKAMRSYQGVEQEEQPDADGY